MTLRAADVRPGDLFAALPGARVHGADFAAAALAAGAAAVLTDPAGAADPALAGVPVLVHRGPRERARRRRGRGLRRPDAPGCRCVGVTGTSGKTTVAHLLEAGLVAAGRTSGLLGTVGTRIDPARRRAALPSAFTTPEAPDLQALFAVMVEARRARDVAMEVSSHALALGRVAGTRFAVAAFTNLSQDHLDFHRDMEDYFAAKAPLFDGRAERAVICVDDELGRAARAPAPRTRSRVSTTDGRRRLARPPTSSTGDRRHPAVHRARPGRRRGAGAARSCPARSTSPTRWSRWPAWTRSGCPPRRPPTRSPRLAVPGRMQRVEAGQPFLAVVDYAHKPAAVAALLDALRAQVAAAG